MRFACCSAARRIRSSRLRGSTSAQRRSSSLERDRRLERQLDLLDGRREPLARRRAGPATTVPAARPTAPAGCSASAVPGSGSPSSAASAAWPIARPCRSATATSPVYCSRGASSPAAPSRKRHGRAAGRALDRLAQRADVVGRGERVLPRQRRRVAGVVDDRRQHGAVGAADATDQQRVVGRRVGVPADQRLPVDGQVAGARDVAAPGRPVERRWDGRGERLARRGARGRAQRVEVRGDQLAARPVARRARQQRTGVRVAERDEHARLVAAGRLDDGGADVPLVLGRAEPGAVEGDEHERRRRRRCRGSRARSAPAAGGRRWSGARRPAPTRSGRSRPAASRRAGRRRSSLRILVPRSSSCIPHIDHYLARRYSI